MAGVPVDDAAVLKDLGQGGDAVQGGVVDGAVLLDGLTISIRQLGVETGTGWPEIAEQVPTSGSGAAPKVDAPQMGADRKSA